MTPENLDDRCESTSARQVILTAFMVCGLFLTGCGGSSETPVATTDSSGGAGTSDAGMGSESSDMGMHGQSMMGSSPGMNNPSMSESMAGGAGEGFGDTSSGHGEGGPDSAEMMALNGGGEGFGDTSTGHGEDGAAAAAHGEGKQFGDTSPGHGEGGPDSAAMAAQMAANGEGKQFGDTSPGHSEGGPGSAAMSAEMAAQMAANGGSRQFGDTSPGHGEGGPGSAAMSAEMAAQMAANGGSGGNEEGGFGPDAEGRGPNGGGGQAQEPPADSPDYPAFKLVMGLMQGKHDGLKEHVSTRGRGLIEKIRGGSLTTAEKDDLKKTFAQPQLVGVPRTIGGSRTVTLNSAGQVITIVSKKQGKSWKVSSISIRAAKKR